MNKINNILNSQSCSTFKKNENVEKPTEPSSVKPISNSKYISSDASSACRAYALAHINKSNYEHKYLNGIQNKTFKRMDGAGNKDGKVTVNEALDDLNIANLLSGQNEADAAKIKAAAEKIPEVLAKYAGEDGEFTAEEWANFLNGQEWGAVLDAWHSSGKDAKSEMNWIDNAHGIPDRAVTKGEVKVGILNNLSAKCADIDTTEIEAIIDKYAGEDGTFTQKEYMELREDPAYKDILNKYDITPWFKF